MTQQQKEIKRYVTQIERSLRLPLKEKARINGDISTDIHARLEAGQSFVQIKAEMGTPQEVAAAMNEMAAENAAPTGSPWRWAFVMLGVAAILVFAVQFGRVLGPLLFPPNAGSIGIIGGADGPTAIYVGYTMPPLWALTLFTLQMVFACLSGYLVLKWGKTGTREIYARVKWLSLAGVFIGLGFVVASFVGFAVSLPSLLSMDGFIALPSFVQHMGTSAWWFFLLSAGSSLKLLLLPGTWLSALFFVVAVRRKKRAAPATKPEQNSLESDSAAE